MFDHQDALEALNHHAPLSEKLKTLRDSLAQRFEFIDRVSVAIYDPKTDDLKTFIHSSGEANPLVQYQAKLSEARSLQEIRESGKPRVVNDLTVFSKGTHEHTHRIAAQGYGASYTVPLYFNSDFFGFVFFNSYRKNVFDEGVLRLLDTFAHLISLVIVGELTALRTLTSSVQAARNFANLRDTETGAHIERMSRYARIIAKELAAKYGFDDEYVEHVFLFSPLHDIGKIGIPDSILLKAGLLDAGERHHETLDGAGYPHRLRGDDIPIESRIVAVADIFDALTSKRPYKEAWSMDDAFQELRKLAGSKLDFDCVEALIKNRAQLEEIRDLFQENPFS